MDNVQPIDLTITGNEDFSGCLNDPGSTLILCRSNNDCEKVRNFEKKIEKTENKNIWTLTVDQQSDGENSFEKVSCQHNGSIFLGIIFGNESILAEPATDKVCFLFLTQKNHSGFGQAYLDFAT